MTTQLQLINIIIIIITAKGVHLSSLKVINKLLQSIRNLIDDTKQFKSALKNYLCTHSLHSVEEYFNVNRER